jgi:hypothetical protein
MYDVNTKEEKNITIFYQNRYCEIIINRAVLIFVANLVVHLNHENKNPTKYNFPINC